MSMGTSNTLGQQINQAAFWSAAVALAAGVVSVFFPLDVPGGYEATASDRAAWLSANSGPFMLGWINQIIAMVSLSGVLAGLAWQIAGTHPLRAILAATLVAISMVAFFIPKFIAVWTIPMLAGAIATGSGASDMAQALLPILNVSVPFSLFTSFDYLGFWLYSLLALLVARPLMQSSVSSKITGAVLGVFGLLYNGVVIAILAGTIEGAEVAIYVGAAALILVFVLVASLFLFKGAAAPTD